MLRFRFAANTHIGHVRSNNEDSAFAGPYLLLVADGVGGQAAGEVASASATYITSAVSMITEEPDPLTVLSQTIQMAHHHLKDGVAADPSRLGMSTTLTAVLCDGERFALAHIGDSRGYLLRAGALNQITRDQTLVQSMVDDGQITTADIQTHPFRSVILQALDAENTPDPDLVMLELMPADRLLLCSDGLSDFVPHDQIAALLNESSLDKALAMLIAAALAAGGRDNVTCVVADVEEGSRVRRYGHLSGAVSSPQNLIDGAAVRLPSSACPIPVTGVSVNTA